jgi:hypothetical protein
MPRGLSGEARILRDRAAAWDVALDRAQADWPPLATPRRLVQVFNGGSMPSQPDHVYLTHPVELDGAEAEGGVASPIVDTSSTIPVVVLWSAPQAGDILTAYAVGGRWVAEVGHSVITNCPVCGCATYPAALHATSTALGANGGSATLTWDGANWTGSSSYIYLGAPLQGCSPYTLPITWTFSASLCELILNWPINTSSGNPCPTDVAHSNGTATQAYNVGLSVRCNPFFVAWGPQPTNGSFSLLLAGNTGTSNASVSDAGGGTVDNRGNCCGGCAIPDRNLTVSWTNPIIGNGSTTLFYNSSALTWTSGCSNELVYQLLCTGGQVEFRAIYFISGPCPTGTQQYCSNLRPNPFGLTQTGLTCGSSFLMTMTCGSACPVLQLDGYTGFIVSA